MKVLIFEVKEIEVLLDRLKLAKFELKTRQPPADEMHRRFHYEVVKWFNEQGA